MNSLQKSPNVLCFSWRDKLKNRVTFPHQYNIYQRPLNLSLTCKWPLSYSERRSVERAKREFDSIIPHRENRRRSPLCCRCCCRYKDEHPLSYTFIISFFFISTGMKREGIDSFSPTLLIWCLTSVSFDLRRESNEFDGRRLTCSCMNAVNAPSR